MTVITYETRGGKVALITMANGENRQNITFAEEMLAALDRAEADKTIRALVIASADEKNWSQGGVELGFLMSAMRGGKPDEVRHFMNTMNQVFARLLLAPFPVIAAITGGHAFGNGGAMLACACDFRFMRADRGYFCLPEVDVGIPFLPSMILYVKKALPQHLFNQMTLTGRRVAAAELEGERVIEAACADAATTLEAALVFADTFNKGGRAIFAENKRRFHEPIVDAMQSQDQPLIDALDLTA